LDQRLQQQNWNAGLSQVVGHTSAHFQPVAEARPLNVEIARQQLELAVERDLLSGAELQSLPEQVAQARNHVVGLVGVVMHHLGDGIQRVEEEVRLQLHVEQLQLRFGKTCLEMLSLAAATVVLQPVCGGNDGRVDEELEGQRADQQI